MRVLPAVLSCCLLVLGLVACGGGSDGSGGAESQTVEQNGVRLELPVQITAGSPFEVTWEGPNESDDYVSIAEQGAEDDASANYTYTRNGSPLTVRAPDTPGDYEVRYVTGANDKVLARAQLPVEEATASLKAPAEIGAGSPIEVSWTGPDNPDDYISVAERGTDGDTYVNYTYARQGSTLTVRAPDTPGAYELRYVTGQSDRVLARSDLKVASVSASFTVPDTLMVNTPVEIDWSGPDNPDDYVSIAERGTPDGDNVNYTYTRNGNPLTLRTPERPGQYELRYVMAQNDRVVARKPTTVLPLQARLRAPESVPAGTGLEVSWIGPNGPDDFIAVAAPDAGPTDYESRALSRAGSPASVFAPSSSGNYVLRYVWAEKDSVLTERSLTVTEE
jgi:Ca-activated chloride channel family protein